MIFSFGLAIHIALNCPEGHDLKSLTLGHSPQVSPIPRTVLNSSIVVDGMQIAFLSHAGSYKDVASPRCHDQALRETHVALQLERMLLWGLVFVLRIGSMARFM